MLNPETTEKLTRKNVTSKIFSSWRLVVSEQESARIRREEAVGALKLVMRYADQAETFSYIDTLADIGPDATGALTNLISESGILTSNNGSTHTVRIMARRVVAAAEYNQQQLTVGDVVQDITSTTIKE